MIIRIKLLSKFYLVCSDINKWYLFGLLLYQHWIAIFQLDLGASCITNHLGIPGISYQIFFLFDGSQLNEFVTDLQGSGKIFQTLRDTTILSWTRSMLALFFNIQTLNNFSTPCVISKNTYSMIVERKKSFIGFEVL